MKYPAIFLLLSGVVFFYPVASVGAEFIRGDSDSNGRVDISDAIFTLQWLFAGGAQPGCLSSADADDNGSIELSDPIYSLGFLFLGGAVFPAPYPDCGDDPSRDRLDCLENPGCGEAEPCLNTLPDICLPAVAGSFPGVLYNHGGLGDSVGGDLEGTCEALSAAGYVGYSKQRRLEDALPPGRQDVAQGLEELLEVSCVDQDRLALVGYSRGGLLSLELALENPDLFDAVVLMAPAPGNGALEKAMADPGLADIRASFLVLVSENDQCQGANHVTIARDLAEALRDAELDVTFEELDEVPDRCGHYLFDTVNDYCEVSADLCYWRLVMNFLDEKVR